MVGSGVAYGNLGYSHHAIQDLTFMRSLPNMIIGTPSDPQQVIEILEYQLANPKPLYLRLHKAGESNLLTCRDSLIPGQLRLLKTKGQAAAKTRDPKPVFYASATLHLKSSKYAKKIYINYQYIQFRYGGPLRVNILQNKLVSMRP